MLYATALRLLCDCNRKDPCGSQISSLLTISPPHYYGQRYIAPLPLTCPSFLGPWCFATLNAHVCVPPIFSTVVLFSVQRLYDREVLAGAACLIFGRHLLGHYSVWSKASLRKYAAFTVNVSLTDSGRSTCSRCWDCCANVSQIRLAHLTKIDCCGSRSTHHVYW